MTENHNKEEIEPEEDNELLSEEMGNIQETS